MAENWGGRDDGAFCGIFSLFCVDDDETRINLWDPLIGWTRGNGKKEKRETERRSAA